ncbi:MAG: aminopeptidase [Candidatus Bathyarchaeota archaeon]|nr:MAG: aminopeptidase [Candidatus Bathyarchaeota archaeon]
MDAWEAAKNALEHVLEAAAGESIFIVCDDKKIEVGKAFANGSLALGLWTRMTILRTTKKWRTEIPEMLLEVFTQQKPNLYVNLMRDTREETPFRIRTIKMETRNRRSRLGHCPGVTIDMLTEGALALSSQEHKTIQSHAGRLIQALSGVTEIQIRSPAGTDLTLGTEKREFFTDTMLDWKSMKWINLPTGEVMVAPVEDSLDGKLVCDMAIGGIGRVKTPVEVIARDGKAEKIVSKDENVLRKIRDTFETDDWSNVVGEFAFGINPRARFVDEFLEAEKILGTIHVAFGNNTDMPGGKNLSKNHIDLLIYKPTVKAKKGDREIFTVLEDGRFRI